MHLLRVVQDFQCSENRKASPQNLILPQARVELKKRQAQLGLISSYSG